MSMAAMIEPGLVPAIVYIFARTVIDLVNLEDSKKIGLSPDILSIKALEHLRCIPDLSDVVADIEQKAHITLATFYLGSNIGGQRIKDSIDTSDIDEAKTRLMTVHQSVYLKETPLSGYREVQLSLVQSIYNYRCSEVRPDQRTCFLGKAIDYAKNAGQANEALCTEELVRAKFDVPSNTLGELLPI